jgi:hypothetical protein
MVWAAVFVGAFVLFWLPVVAAAIRGTEPLWLVILLTVLTPLGGVTWFGAWILAFTLPRRRPAPPPRRALLPQDDPRYLFGGVPPADTAAVVTRRAVGAGSGASAWS